MKIGIVLHPYGEKKQSGLGRCMFDWTKSLLEEDLENEYVIFLKEQPKEKPPLPGRWMLHVLGGAGFFWQNNLFKKPACDVYLFQTPILPLKKLPGKIVVMIQDFPYRYFKTRSPREWFYNQALGWYHHHSLKRADIIITPSEWAKDEVVRLFGIPKEKVSVIPIGFTDICKKPETAISLSEKFFLFAGVIKERKNVHTIIRAFALFKKNNPASPHKFVLAGKREGAYYENIVGLIQKLGVQNDIIFSEYLDDGKLSYAYKRAEALVFPSTVESFGFPVLEAFACGVPVITSNFGGPSETGSGGAALLVNPHNAYEISSAMERVVYDAALCRRLVAAGKERAKEYSWKRTATETLRLIDTISGS